MGLFKSLKGNRLDHVGQDFAIDYEACQPPPGPPPSHLAEAEKVTPTDDFQPPPGPPPFQVPADNPPPYHDWTSIPDTSLLPPPPSLGHKSSRNNATWDDAARAHAFCDRFPPYLPAQPPAVVQEAVRHGRVALERPTEYAGELKPVTSRLPGLWSARSRRGCGDCVFLSNLPLYLAATDSPLHTHQPKTIYFEVHVISPGRGDNGIAVGYCAKPYPSWRLPGWERASLGVHGDDGRRFVSDTWGGKDFTTKFVEGETVGIGMEFSVPAEGAGAGAGTGAGADGAGKAPAEVFFTRNGNRDGGWLVDEELDQDDQSEGAQGLNGELDLYAAIGLFGDVEFQVVFSPQHWIYQPRR